MHCDCIQITNEALYHYNRLVGTAATRKFYEEFPQWKVQITAAFENLVCRFNMRSEEKNKLLSRMAAINFCGIVERCVGSKTRKAAIDVISKSFLTFKEKMFVDTAWKDMHGYSQDLLLAILAENMEEIYGAQVKRMKRNRLKKFVKRHIKGLVTPIIERKRDGLRSAR